MTEPIDEAHRISLALTRKIREWHAAMTERVNQFDIRPMPPNWRPDPKE